MSLQLHFVEQIVNVQWGGGIFVVKSLMGFIYRGSGKNTDDWQSIGQPKKISGFLGANSGSSYAEIGKTDSEPGNSVFVISATREDDDGNFGSFILASDDGQSWEIAFEQYEVNDGDHRDPWIFQPTGIVWDNDVNKFYASFLRTIADFDDVTGVTAVDHENIYSSADGYSWSLLSTTPLPSSDTVDANTVTSAIIQYCNKPENTKGPVKVPDGLQAYSEGSDTLIMPTALRGFEPWNGAFYNRRSGEFSGEEYGAADPSVNVITIDEGGNKVTETVAVSADCYAVAQVNGVWVACGGTLTDLFQPGNTLTVDISLNGGKEWKQVYKNSSEGDWGSYHAASVSAGQQKTKPDGAG
jgi:hypothetical protein